MRSAAQIVAYEIAMGFALVGVLMAPGSLNLGNIVRTSKAAIGRLELVLAVPAVLVYFISGVAETNRAPFDVAEGESEIVAGFHVEYSGIAFALFFRPNTPICILISALTAVFFFGGWLRPFQGWPAWWPPSWRLPSFLWLALKVVLLPVPVPVVPATFRATAMTRSCVWAGRR